MSMVFKRRISTIEMKKGCIIGVSMQAKVVVKATKCNKFVTTNGNQEQVVVIESIYLTSDLQP